MASLAMTDRFYRDVPCGKSAFLDPHLLTDIEFARPLPKEMEIDTGLRAGVKLTSSSYVVPEPVAEAINRLRELEALQPGWDSYGGRPMSDKVVQPALTLIIDAWRTCNQPRIHLNGRGGLDLFWDSPTKSLEVSINGPRECEVYFEDTETGDEYESPTPVSLEEARSVLRRYCAQ
jgi:hypothetical protein